MKDPCVPSLPKGPFIPILTHWSGLKLNPKNKETYICILGPTNFLLQRLWANLFYTKENFVVWIYTVSWHIIKMGGWMGKIQPRDKLYRTNRNNRAHKQPNPWSLCPRGFLSNEMKRAPCKAKANKTGNQDQSLLLKEKCSQRLRSCFVGIWFILKEFELPFYPIQLLLIPLRLHGCLHVTQKHIVMAT